MEVYRELRSASGLIRHRIQAHTAGVIARFLIALLALSLVGLLVAAVEGRAAWVYAATGAFMVIGVMLALHTAFGRSRPARGLQSVGFGPTRQSGVWRAIVDGVPVEAILNGAQIVLRAAGVPESLSVHAGDTGQPTGDPEFDAAARCVGRAAEVAALSSKLRAELLPLLAMGVQVRAGAVCLPASASVEVMHRAAQVAAALAQTLRDVRSALLHRVRTEPPHIHLLAASALAAGWPNDARVGQAVQALVDHPDDDVQRRGAEILETIKAVRSA